MSIKSIFDWIYRLIKGMFIGTGILPGVSGGALAAVWLVRTDHRFYRTHAGISGAMCFLYRSRSRRLLGRLCRIRLIILNTARIQVLWCFVGCIAGTLPALYREAGKEGGKNGIFDYGLHHDSGVRYC